MANSQNILLRIMKSFKEVLEASKEQVLEARKYKIENEKVALLDTDEHGDYKTNSQSEYHADYGSSEGNAKSAVINYVKTGTATGVEVKTGATSSFIANQPIQLAQLDNKNQMKYSLNMKNKEYGTNATPEDPYMNYVYRAYSYIRIGDKVVVSDPTYFTIYDIASIEPHA